MRVLRRSNLLFRMACRIDMRYLHAHHPPLGARLGLCVLAAEVAAQVERWRGEPGEAPEGRVGIRGEGNALHSCGPFAIASMAVFQRATCLRLPRGARVFTVRGGLLWPFGGVSSAMS